MLSEVAPGALQRNNDRIEQCARVLLAEHTTLSLEVASERRIGAGH